MGRSEHCPAEPSAPEGVARAYPEGAPAQSRLPPIFLGELVCPWFAGG